MAKKTLKEEKIVVEKVIDEPVKSEAIVAEKVLSEKVVSDVVATVEKNDSVVEPIVAELALIEPVVEEAVVVTEPVKLNQGEANKLGILQRNGMSFADAKKMILAQRDPVKLVNVNSQEAKEAIAVKEIKLGKTDGERKLLLLNKISGGMSMAKAMVFAYGEGCKNIDGKIYTKDQLLLIEK